MDIIISNLVPDYIVEYLSKYGKIHFLKKDFNMPDPISTHPDSLIFRDGKTIYIPKGYDYGYSLLSDIGLSALKTTEEEGNKYPNDTIVNSFVYSSYIFSGENISADILNYATDMGYSHIVVRQGYAHCSSIVLNNGIITQDKGIYKECILHNIDCLYINQGNILLPGYDTGFIGGSCLVIQNDVIFYGDVRMHPDYNEIVSFIEKMGYKIKYFENKPLTDYGGGIVI